MFTITNLIILFAVLALAGMFIYWGRKKPDLEEDETFEDSELTYGAFVKLNMSYANSVNLSHKEKYFITVPTIHTPEGFIRIETNTGHEVDIPKNKIASVHYDLDSPIPVEQESALLRSREYPKSSKNSLSERYSSDPFSAGIIAQMGAGEILEQSNNDKAYDDQPETKSFGNGGEFAGGGASGSYEGNTKSTYEPAHNHSSYQSEPAQEHASYSSYDHSSSHDSGSSYDSSSSDSSSSSND